MSGRIAMAADHAVMLPRRDGQLCTESGSMYCTCRDLTRELLRDTADRTMARGGTLALVLLAGTYAGRVIAKSKHKEGEITCYTYRKIKEMVNAQPWFTIPLIAVPIINYNEINPWRPPFASYGLMVGGWMVNMTGHILRISTKEEKYTKYAILGSYGAWGLSIIITVLGMGLIKRTSGSC